MKCRKCGNETDNLFGYCEQCIIENQKKFFARREADKAKKRAKYQERKANHLCIDCCSPVTDTIRCRECADKTNAMLREYRLRHPRAKYTEAERREIWSRNGYIRALANNEKRRAGL